MAGNKLNFDAMKQRKDQAENALERSNRAAAMMRKQTFQQGYQMVFKYIETTVMERTAEGWRTAAKIVFPKWYYLAWFKSKLLCLFLLESFWMLKVLVPLTAGVVFFRHLKPGLLSWLLVSAFEKAVQVDLIAYAWPMVVWIAAQPILKRCSQILARGGHIARVSQTQHEFTVRIKLFRWWRLVYTCDFDVRNGRVSEAAHRPPEKISLDGMTAANIKRVS